MCALKILMNEVSNTRIMVEKPKTKRMSRKAFLEYAKTRLPSARSVMCQGCFSRRNTLTVKLNLNVLWRRELIQVEFTGEEGAISVVVTLPCSLCHELRKLKLNDWSSQSFKADWDNDQSVYMLQKHPDNGFVSFTAVNKDIIPENYEKWCNP